MAPASHNLADYWSEIQGSLTDALLQYQRVHPEMIQLMKENDYFNTLIRNVFANGWVRGNMAATKALDHCLALLLVRVELANPLVVGEGLALHLPRLLPDSTSHGMLK